MLSSRAFAAHTAACPKSIAFGMAPGHLGRPCSAAAARPAGQSLSRSSTLLVMASKRKGFGRPQKGRPPAWTLGSKGGSGTSSADTDPILQRFIKSGDHPLMLLNYIMAEESEVKASMAQGRVIADMVNSPSFERAGWTKGLSQQQLHEYLVDCFRLVSWAEYFSVGKTSQRPALGHHYYTTFIENMTYEDGIKIFFTFTKLAVQRGVLPASRPDWCWDTFFKYAAQQLPYCCDEEDAAKKWGVQDVQALSVSPLQLTATAVYGLEPLSGEGQVCLESQQEEVVPYGKPSATLTSLFSQRPQLFAEVGGVERWQRLAAEVRKWPVLGLQVEANRPAGGRAVLQACLDDANGAVTRRAGAGPGVYESHP